MSDLSPIVGFQGSLADQAFLAAQWDIPGIYDFNFHEEYQWVSSHITWDGEVYLIDDSMCLGGGELMENLRAHGVKRIRW